MIQRIGFGAKLQINDEIMPMPDCVKKGATDAAEILEEKYADDPKTYNFVHFANAYLLCESKGGDEGRPFLPDENKEFQTQKGTTDWIIKQYKKIKEN